MSGTCIPLEHPFTHSWLWEYDKMVFMSMIIVKEEERGKGHTKALIIRLKNKYDTICLSYPSDTMKKIIKSEGFGKVAIGQWCWQRGDKE